MCALSLTAAILQLIQYAVNEATGLIADNKILFVKYSYLITYAHVTERLPNPYECMVQLINVCFEECVCLWHKLVLTHSAPNLEQT